MEIKILGQGTDCFACGEGEFELLENVNDYKLIIIEHFCNYGSARGTVTLVPELEITKCNDSFHANPPLRPILSMGARAEISLQGNKLTIDNLKVFDENSQLIDGTNFKIIKVVGVK